MLSEEISQKWPPYSSLQALVCFYHPWVGKALSAPNLPDSCAQHFWLSRSGLPNHRNPWDLVTWWIGQQRLLVSYIWVMSWYTGLNPWTGVSCAWCRTSQWRKKVALHHLCSKLILRSGCQMEWSLWLAPGRTLVVLNWRRICPGNLSQLKQPSPPLIPH